jgi:preprotein translocase subunit SecD
VRPGRLLAWVLGTVVVSIGGLLGVFAAGWAPLLGLDLKGGISVVFAPVHPVGTATLNEAIDIIRNRVDALGVAEPNIARQGADDIVVQLPGVHNRNQALHIIGETAELFFRPVLCGGGNTPLPLGPTNSRGQPLTTSAPPPSCGAPNVDWAKVPNSSSALFTNPSKTVLVEARNPSTGALDYRMELGPALASGNIIKTATAGLTTTNSWAVDFTLTSKGATTFNQIANRYYGQQVAIVLDGVVESAPVIQSRNFNGQGQITGAFTQQEASNLALVLRYGALPVQLNQLQVQSVSPTLGTAALRAGIFAGVGGLVLVMLYMIFYYRALGLVVVAGLASTAALLYAIVSLLSHTNGLALTLSGATGLIVSIGITVDSYIVYFERLKDEVRAGNSVRVSVDRSFARAFRTIIAADLVSLIGAVVLYLLSIGDVRGFAFFLGLSTLLDMLTAWSFTRPLVILLGRSKTITEAGRLGVARGLAVEAPTP